MFSHFRKMSILPSNLTLHGIGQTKAGAECKVLRLCFSLPLATYTKHNFMSWVTDVLLTFNLEERFDDDYNILESCETLNNINAWLENHEYGRLDELSIHVQSGGKAMQTYVYGGAFNFMNIDDFVILVLSQTWKMPESVMLLTKDEGQNIFTVHQITKPVA